MFAPSRAASLFISSAAQSTTLSPLQIPYFTGFQPVKAFKTAAYQVSSPWQTVNASETRAEGTFLSPIGRPVISRANTVW